MLLVFVSLPFVTQRAPNAWPTRNAQARSHAFPPASSAATAAATRAESVTVMPGAAPNVARSALVAARATAVSPGSSTFACSPSNRKASTATAGAGGERGGEPLLWAARLVTNPKTRRGSGARRTTGSQSRKGRDAGDPQ